jgi:hypothetical protein
MDQYNCPYTDKLKLLTGFSEILKQYNYEPVTLLTTEEIECLYECSEYNDTYAQTNDMLICYKLQIKISNYFKNNILSVNDITLRKYDESPSISSNRYLPMSALGMTIYEPMVITYIDMNKPWIRYNYRDIDNNCNKSINNYKYMIKKAEKNFGG